MNRNTKVARQRGYTDASHKTRITRGRKVDSSKERYERGRKPWGISLPGYKKEPRQQHNT